jgi:hypothetical protein
MVIPNWEALFCHVAHLFNLGVAIDQANNPIWGFLIALNPLARNAVRMAGETCWSRADLGWCEDVR